MVVREKRVAKVSVAWLLWNRYLMMCSALHMHGLECSMNVPLHAKERCLAVYGADVEECASTGNLQCVNVPEGLWHLLCKV
jgi:hypothetical protein